MRYLLIEPQKEGRGRSFRAIPIAMVTASRLWGGGGDDSIRPIWIMMAGSEEEIRPFAANLRLGKKAVLKSGNGNWRRRGETKVELLKSAGYQFAWQRTAEGSVLTAFLPEFFRLDPGMVDPKGIQFCVLPSKQWVASQALDPRPAVDHMMRLDPGLPRERLTELAPVAALFCAYLDRRTRCPLINDQRFYLQVLCAALADGVASFSTPVGHYYGEVGWGQHKFFGFEEEDTADVGLLPGVACSAEHVAIEKLLAEQAQIYFKTI